MEINRNGDKVRVDVAADLGAAELLDLIRRIGTAHGELTNVLAPDTGIARFVAAGIDIRPAGDFVQLSLLGPCGWVQMHFSRQQAQSVMELLQHSIQGAPTGTPLN